MSKLPLKKRRKEPSDVVRNSFQASLLDFTSDFLRSQPFRHALTKGEERETPLRVFFSENLPKTYAVSCGEVVDLFENHSPQLDLVIYNHLQNVVFYSGTSIILPAEALLVSVEVKSILTLDEITKSLLAARQLRKLRPFRKQLAHARQGGENADDGCRYFHCVFAYNSDLAIGNGWLQREYKRFTKAVDDIGGQLDYIDRIYVANRGLLNPDKNFGVSEASNPGIALLHFFTDVLNFLSRENKRREPVPYDGYAGRVGNLWEKLA